MNRARNSVSRSAGLFAALYLLTLPSLAQVAAGSTLTTNNTLSTWTTKTLSKCSSLLPNVRAATCVASLGFAKVVFVTTNAYSANLDGTAGANAICQTEANSAGLPGIYKAWLSTSNTYGGNAAIKDEPINTFNHSLVPYVLSDQHLTRVAANWSKFASLDHQHDIGKDASGNDVPQDDPVTILGAWTGTNADGTATANNCQNWTNTTNVVGGDIGYVNAISEPFGGLFGTWTLETIPGGAACDQVAHLYCVQQ